MRFKTIALTVGIFLILMVIFYFDAATPDWLALGAIMVALFGIELDTRDKQYKDMMQVKLNIQKIMDHLKIKDRADD